MSKSRRTYKYRLWPNRKQREVLFSKLEVCRQLYNDALEERREAWKLCRTWVSLTPCNRRSWPPAKQPTVQG
ncbi:MAG: hypothetical protein DMG69_12755 [Acidobacteria bacterium]|nr:MAG: hypothetical protein DMG69_12755 [Acidobacteriota bacterium]